jgi:hypothetical protein
MYCTFIWEKISFMGCFAPPIREGCRGSGARAPEKKKLSIFLCLFFGCFSGQFFLHGFLIPIKELRLLTNSSQWIRGLDGNWRKYHSTPPY